MTITTNSAAAATAAAAADPDPDATAPDALTPSDRTLLLKHGRSTVLLCVPPSTPLLEVKRQLLGVLASRDMANFPGTDDLPLPHHDPAALELGVLVDRKDVLRGWRLLYEDENNSTTSTSATTTITAGSGGTTRSTPRGVGGRANKLSTKIGTVEAAGLLSGTWIAYRLSRQRRREQRGREQQQQQQQQHNNGNHDNNNGNKEQDLDLDDDDIDDPGWNVVPATCEEADAAAAAREAADAAAWGKQDDDDDDDDDDD